MSPSSTNRTTGRCVKHQWNEIKQKYVYHSFDVKSWRFVPPPSEPKDCNVFPVQIMNVSTHFTHIVETVEVDTLREHSGRTKS